jgi:hypothetical protein
MDRKIETFEIFAVSLPEGCLPSFLLVINVRRRAQLMSQLTLENAPVSFGWGDKNTVKTVPKATAWGEFKKSIKKAVLPSLHDKQMAEKAEKLQLETCRAVKEVEDKTILPDSMVAACQRS